VKSPKIEVVQRTVTTVYVRVADKWLFPVSEKVQEKVTVKK